MIQFMHYQEIELLTLAPGSPALHKQNGIILLERKK